MEHDTELLTIDQVCEFWGGKLAPLHYTTIYRQIKLGHHPKPLKVGQQASRWLYSELIAERSRRIAARDGEAA
jgi:predicted DNA-binding transcriptional regulator AlpA